MEEMLLEMKEDNVTPEQFKILRALEYIYYCGSQITGSSLLSDDRSKARKLSNNEQSTRDAALNCLFHYFSPSVKDETLIVVVPQKVFNEMTAAEKSGDIKRITRTRNKITNAAAGVIKNANEKK